MASSLRRAIAYILINRRFSALLSHFASDLGLVKLASISFACPRHSLATRILTASRFFDALLSLSLGLSSFAAHMVGAMVNILMQMTSAAVDDIE